MEPARLKYDAVCAVNFFLRSSKENRLQCLRWRSEPNNRTTESWIELKLKQIEKRQRTTYLKVILNSCRWRIVRSLSSIESMVFSFHSNSLCLCIERACALPCFATHLLHAMAYWDVSNRTISIHKKKTGIIASSLWYNKIVRKINTRIARQLTTRASDVTIPAFSSTEQPKAFVVIQSIELSLSQNTHTHTRTYNFTHLIQILSPQRTQSFIHVRKHRTKHFVFSK